jgi:hypothetical protein
MSSGEILEQWLFYRDHTSACDSISLALLDLTRKTYALDYYMAAL